MPKEAMLYQKLDSGKVRCALCSQGCRIEEGGFGFCRVRQNQQGSLKSLVYGAAAALGADPIEKKPFYHFLPGTLSYSIATVGCNFRCSFCQNWQISQAGAGKMPLFSDLVTSDKVVKAALKSNSRSISYTYTEPTVFFEYAYDTARLAKKNNLYNLFVTNGYMTKSALDKIRPYLDAANVDLKSFSDEFYKKRCSGRLNPVLESIKYMKKLGIWVEVTTLLVPGFNDSEEEISRIAQFITGIDCGIPWHISRFHPSYKISDNYPTSIEVLEKAYFLGKKTGLKYVYLGNVSREADTCCPVCKRKVIIRSGFRVKENNLKEGRCLFCKNPIEGVF